MPGEVPTVSVADVPESAAGRVLLDVREHNEWNAGHAPSAVHIPMGEIPGRMSELPDGEILVICRVGGRSAQVTAFLNAQGRNAKNVDGGMLAWSASNRPMVSEKADGEPKVL